MTSSIDLNPLAYFKPIRYLQFASETVMDFPFLILILLVFQTYIFFYISKNIFQTSKIDIYTRRLNIIRLQRRR